MTIFSLRGSTALIALSVSLSLALPGMLVAQDSQPGVVAPEAAWQPLTRLGFAFEVPPGAAVTDQSDTEGARYFAVSTMGADGIGARLGMRFLTAAEMAEVPAPGTPEFAAYLGDLGSVPVSATGTVLALGGRQMLVYAGTGSVPAPGGVRHEGRMLYLVSQSAEADGSTLLIAVFSAGVGGGVAAELEARFVTSLRPVEDQPEGETAPEDGASDTPDAAPADAAAEVAAVEEPAAVVAAAPEPDAPVTAVAPTAPPPEADAEVAAAPEPDPQAAILAAFAQMPAPSGLTSEGWQRHEAFGLSFAAPAEAILRDRSGRGPQQLATRLRDRQTRSQLDIVVAALGPADVAEMGVTPGSDEFLAMINARAHVPVALMPNPVMVGARPMRAYFGLGTRSSGPADVYEIGVHLLSAEPDESGTWYLLSADAFGYPEDEARRLVAQALASMTEAPPEAAPADAGHIEILAGLAAIDTPEGLVLADERRTDSSTDLYFADSASPDTPLLRISAGMLTRSVSGQVGRMLHRVDALVETEVGGQPVWVLHGIATRGLDNRRATVEQAIPAQLVAPRFCVDGTPPYMLGILGGPGDEARIDRLTAALQLALPEAAVPCGDEVVAEVRAAMNAQVAATAEPPAPVIPEGWVAHQRFGLSFAAPVGMVVRRERTEPDQLEYWLQLPNAEGSITREISLRVFNPEARARLPHALPDEDGFAAMLTRFADLPIVATDERVTLGGQTMRVFRGAGTRTVAGAEFVSRVLYLIAEAPGAQGLTPWIALQGIDHSAEAEAEFEAAFIASLGGQAELPAPEPAEPQAEASPPPAIVMPPMPPMPTVTPEPPARPAATAEALAWQAASASGTPEAVLAYLAQYPRGLHSGEARAWLYARDIIPPDERRPGPIEPPAAPARVEADDWRGTLAENRVEAYWTYLKHWPEGSYVAEARLMLGRLLYVAPPVPEPTPPPTK